MGLLKGCEGDETVESNDNPTELEGCQAKEYPQQHRDGLGKALTGLESQEDLELLGSCKKYLGK